MKKHQSISPVTRRCYVRPCAWAETFAPDGVLCESADDSATSEDYLFDDIWSINS